MRPHTPAVGDARPSAQDASADPLTLIPKANQFGPWEIDITNTERLARTRAFHALARVLAGPRATALCNYLATAERDVSALPRALAELNRLGSIDMRRIVASYSALARATAPCAA